jgi:catechol 2,3-dioxygenase-like lactoylglutathione lyase family enzyme
VIELNGQVKHAVRFMNKPYLHHILIGVNDLERSRKFYRDVLELEEIASPPFDFPGLWFRTGDAEQHLHIIVGMGALAGRTILKTFTSPCA